MNTRRSFFSKFSFGIFSIALGLLWLDAPVNAGVATGSSTGWFTQGGVAGSNWLFGSQVTLTYANGTVTQALVGTGGTFWDPQPSGTNNGSAVKVEGTEADGSHGLVTTSLASLFTPSNNVVVTSFTVQPDSKLTIGGTVVSLAGAFTSYETGLDSSKNMTGYVSSNGFVLGNTAAGLGISLSGNTSFSYNVASIDAAAQVQNFVSASTTLGSTPMSLIINYNNQTYTATGSITGTLTSFVGNDDTDVFTGSFTAPGLGTVSLYLDTNTSSVLAVPEPSPWMLFGTAFLVVVGVHAFVKRRNAGPTRLRWKSATFSASAA